MATAPMNRSAFPYQTDREIAKMFYGSYADLPAEWSKIAKVETFPKGRYLSQAELSPLGALQSMGEGEEITFDTPAEGHKKTVSVVKFGLGFQVTEEMLEDDLQGQVSKLPQSLARSAGFCIEQNFWNLFNNGFASELAWDGQYVFDSDHVTMKSGTTISNLGSADLSQTSLEAAFEYYDGLVDEAGFPLMMKPDKLVIPTELKWVANDLLKATGRVWDYTSRSGGYVTVATGDSVAPGSGPLMNGVNPSNGIVDGWNIVVSHYLTDPDAWFLLAPEHGFTFYWKKQPKMESSDSFGTGSKLYKVTTRFKPTVWDYKGSYGSPGA
jgi:hypothetical protein